MIDLNTFDTQEIRVLAQAGSLGNGKFKQVIKKVAEEAKDRLVVADDMVRVHRLQGRVEVLDALVEAIEEASKLQ